MDASAPIRVVEFERDAAYRIGDATYLVTAHYDERGDTLKENMRQLLLEKIERDHPG